MSESNPPLPLVSAGDFPPEPVGWTDVDTAGAAPLLGIALSTLRKQVTAGSCFYHRLGTRKGVRFTWREICLNRARGQVRPTEELAAPVPGVPDAPAGIDPKVLAHGASIRRRAAKAA